MPEAESLRQVAHSRAPLTTWVGIVLLSALFGIIVVAVIGPAPRGSTYEELRAKKRMENLKTVRDEAAKALATYGWIDKNKGIAHIPIDRAMELAVADLPRKNHPHAGPFPPPDLRPPAPPRRPAPPPPLPALSRQRPP